MTDRKGFAVVMRKGREMYRIGEVSEITGVKAGTIRFYEKCGFWPDGKEEKITLGSEATEIRMIFPH